MKRSISIFLTLVLLCTGGLLSVNASASHDKEPCGDLTLVFARGSGQSLDFREAPKFFKSISDRMGDSVRVNTYELGTESHGGTRYVAAGAGLDSIQNFKNYLEAEASWTGGAGGKYRVSVRDGAKELNSYLAARASHCRDETFVIGGYSQGAQVTGDALEGMERSVRDRIAYVALFGDPKLYLPEGRGPIPPACVGKQFSKWRRGNVSCYTDNGILEARKPYLPKDIEDRTGSWCDRNDHICNNNMSDMMWSAHGYYAEDGAEMDEAALEIAGVLADRWPERRDQFNVGIIPLGFGTAGIDVAFVIDTTGSMSGHIASARATADAVGVTIVDGLRGRVAVTEYKDQGDPIIAEVRVPLTTNLTQFRSGLTGLSASGGGDTPEALLTALMTTFDELHWTPGAMKAAIVLTDAGYHDPDKAKGYTTTDVARRALEIDPVNVYPVVPSSLVPDYQELADATSGKVIPNTGNTEEAILEAVTEIRLRPTVLFAMEHMYGPIGSEFVFDASRSYDPDSEIVAFEWDFDGDGVIDKTSTEPTISHVFDEPFDGMVELRVRSADGGVANGIVYVTVSAEGSAGLAPTEPTDVGTRGIEDPTYGRTTEITFGAPTGGGEVQTYRAVDGDGWVVGMAGNDARSILIKGVPPEGGRYTLVATNEFGSSAGVEVVVSSLDVPMSGDNSQDQLAGDTNTTDRDDAAGASTPIDTRSTVGTSRVDDVAVPGDRDESSSEKGRSTPEQPRTMAYGGTNAVPLLVVGALAILSGTIMLVGSKRRRDNALST